MTRKHFGVSLSSSRDKKFGITSENSATDIETLVQHLFVYDFTENCARQSISEEIFIKTPHDGDL